MKFGIDTERHSSRGKGYGENPISSLEKSKFVRTAPHPALPVSVKEANKKFFGSPICKNFMKEIINLVFLGATTSGF